MKNHKKPFEAFMRSRKAQRALGYAGCIAATVSTACTMYDGAKVVYKTFVEVRKYFKKQKEKEEA